MSNNKSGDWILPTAIIVVCVVTFIIWEFAKTFGLDFATGKEVLKWLVPTTIIWLALWLFSAVPFKETWPLALASIWFCWWPALDYWSEHSLTRSFVQYEVMEPVWYTMWYSKWGGPAVIVAFCYAIQSWLSTEPTEEP